MASAMSGGSAYLLKSTTSTDGSTNIKLYMYIVPTWDSSTRKTSTKLGLKVNSNYNIGKWSDFGDSKLYNTTFTGTVPASTKGDYWLVSNVTGPTISHGNDGSASAVSINWYWDVHSTWGGFNNANGSYSYTATKQAAKKFTVTYNANGGTCSTTSASISYNSTIGTLPTASKTGYTFNGWYTAASGGTKITTSTKVTAAVTYYAQYSINSYNIKYDANGGSGGTTKSLNYNVGVLANAPTVTRTNYNFIGWFTAASGGTQITSSTKVGTAAATYYAHWELATSKCGTPTGLSVTANNDNTVTVACTAGSDGVDNTVQSVTFFITYDGTTPSATNYNHIQTVTTTQNTAISKVISLANFTPESIGPIFGSDYIGTINVKARAQGSAGSSFYSDLTSNANARLTWHGPLSSPTFTFPTALHDTASFGIVNSTPGPCVVRWSPASAGINTTVSKYNLNIIDVDTNARVGIFEVDASTTACDVRSGQMKAGGRYQVYLNPVSSPSGFGGPTIKSGIFTLTSTYNMPEIFPTISNPGTVPTTSIYEGPESYLNIGSGDVVKFSWTVPSGLVDDLSYCWLGVYDLDSEIYCFSDSVGKDNELYLTSDMLNRLGSGRHTLVAEMSMHNKYSSEFDSDVTVTMFQVINGCNGIYIKTFTEAGETIMKRAIPFVKQADGSWKLSNGAYYKADGQTWNSSDIKYEVLVDANGNVVTDSLTGEPIYLL